VAVNDIRGVKPISRAKKAPSFGGAGL
jgi:hypothetical protein